MFYFVRMLALHDIEWKAKLSDRDKLFLLEFAQNDDIEDAVVKAGFDPTTASWQGTKILAKAGAKDQLDVIRTKLGKSTSSISMDELIKGFRIISEANITDFYGFDGEVMDVTEMDPEKAKAIKSIKRTVNPRTGAVTVEVTMHDKIAALTNLGKMGGHYAADNGQTQGNVNIQLNLPGGLAGI